MKLLSARVSVRRLKWVTQASNSPNRCWRILQKGMITRLILSQTGIFQHLQAPADYVQPRKICYSLSRLIWAWLVRLYLQRCKKRINLNIPIPKGNLGRKSGWDGSSKRGSAQKSGTTLARRAATIHTLLLIRRSAEASSFSQTQKTKYLILAYTYLIANLCYRSRLIQTYSMLMSGNISLSLIQASSSNSAVKELSFL